MKTPTNLDAIDSSWSWSADPELYWEGDVLKTELPEGCEKWTDEQWWEWEGPSKVYKPLRDHTALFIEFSGTPPTRAGILKFAISYGLLSHERTEVTKKQWVNAIAEMRDAVGLWRAVEGSSEITRDGVSADLLTRWPDILDRKDNSTPTRSDVIDRCKQILRSFTNKQLRNHATHAQVVLTPNGDFQLTFRPQNLWGALWLQFAQAIAHNYSIKICRGCGKPFQAGAGTMRRADATTCKDSCRQMAYRKEHLPSSVRGRS